MSEPLAVIGVACRFPGGANSPEAYWQLLAEGREGVTDVPRSRWDIDAFFDPDPEKPGKINTRRGGFLDDVAGFDAAFFGISPREAAAMDPQQRILLEVVWEALERAGQDVHALGGSDTAVFIGVLGNDFALLNNRRVDRLDVYSGTGAAHNILAGRVAYLFDFHGPAVAVNTACSSSLVAVHTACQSLRAGECGMAIAGGVNLMLAAESTMELSRLGILAPDGRCKTFDARADGFVRSDGCGAVVLKRLADAIQAGDPVLAVIRSSAVNQDGRSAGLMAPNGQAQQAVVRQALANCGVAAHDVEYVETHGSGTALGDQIEVEALRAVYGETGSRPCVLGAVKTNIGHTEASAGIAGLIKAVLALGAEAIPGNLHLERVNPNLPLAGCRLELARGLRPWPRGGRRRYAAVSAFGWSGTNAHVVLEEAPHQEETVEHTRSCYLLPVSGRSRDAARAMATRYAETINADNYARVCATAGARRAHHRYRGAAVGRTVEEIRSALTIADVGEPSDGGGVVFVYPGQGGQWAGMGRQLYEEENVFRNVIRECAAAIREEAGWDLEAYILAGADWQGIDCIQPALMAVSVALTAQWRHWGIQPAVVVGHSMGEVAAAHVAGALTIEDATRVICRRSRLLKSLAGRGGMSVVEMEADAVGRAIATYGGQVSIAATNSRRSTVVSGDLDALDALGREWEAEGVYWRRVQVDVASHCGHVDGLRADLEVALRDLRPQPATLPMRSTVTGALVRGDELEARYWLKNLRERVRFVEAIEGLVAEGYRRFVEVGPHGVLIGAIEEALGRERGVVVGSLRRAEHDRASLLQSLGSLYQWGANVEWRRVNGAPSRPVILPEYAWQRQQYALPNDVNEPSQRFRGGASIAGERDLHVWHLDLEDGHRVAGRDVMAGAAYVEAVMCGMAEVHGGGEWEVRDVHWKELLERGREVQLVIEEDRFEVHSRGEDEKSWQPHADGRVVRAAFPRATFDVD
ncbi:MAG: type I polyketide synthase, partial [Longimicrobiales bacterium]